MYLPVLHSLRSGRYSRRTGARARVGTGARRRYGAGKTPGLWSTRISPSIRRGTHYTVQNVIVPTAKRTGRGMKYTVKSVIVPTSKAVGRGMRYSAKKGYQGIAYASPRIYRGAGRAYRALSPLVVGAARGVRRAYESWVHSPTYQWLAGNAVNARKGVEDRLRHFHDYMMSP